MKQHALNPQLSRYQRCVLLLNYARFMHARAKERERWRRRALTTISKCALIFCRRIMNSIVAKNSVLFVCLYVRKIRCVHTIGAIEYEQTQNFQPTYSNGSFCVRGNRTKNGGFSVQQENLRNECYDQREQI